MQAVKKGAAQSSSRTQIGQGEKALKSRWWPRDGCNGWSMATIQVNFVLIPSEAGMRQHKFT